MKKLVIGVFAHVDAGKTTLVESLLFLTGMIRKPGRVDHKDTFLDNFALERARGITIFSKQAIIKYDDLEITILDTPGHVDFSAEMERTLQVLDYAVLVVSGTDGVQSHTATLWDMFRRYKLPVFLFVNKMDMDGSYTVGRMQEIKERLDENCINFCEDREKWLENLALCDEEILEQYMEQGDIRGEDIALLVSARKVFPCYFGSALKVQGIEELLEGLRMYTKSPSYLEEFAAKVFKIVYEDGLRLTYMKITGGSLRVKDVLEGTIEGEDGSASREEGENGSRAQDNWREKADQIRLYSGSTYQTVGEVKAGDICAVKGLSYTYAGENLGAERSPNIKLLEPVLQYRLLLPEGCDALVFYKKCKQLEEEEPSLHVSLEGKAIHVHVMGEVQTEILGSLIKDRFGIEVGFGEGSILYKETIRGKSLGMGHFEPLRHYAEVQLLLEEGERGSGLCIASACSEDILSRNWQRLIMTHLEEREHPGVLTGSPITDIKISLVTGRAHVKHTEGGDFRQATYRAVRQGLKSARSVLLEPYYEFRLELPQEFVGRAMTDIDTMHGKFALPQTDGTNAILMGRAPVSTMRNYMAEVNAYTRGEGRLSCVPCGFDECHNTKEVLEQMAYDSEEDVSNPTGSVFCSHGAGYIVPWDEVPSHVHMDSGICITDDGDIKHLEIMEDMSGTDARPQKETKDFFESEKELEAIFERTYGPVKERHAAHPQTREYSRNKEAQEAATRAYKEAHPAAFGKEDKKRENYLLVDGYNIIFAWPQLKELATNVSLDVARTKLMELLCNYQAYVGCRLILVFDAYKVKGNPGEVTTYNNISVVYTKEAETADMYIEKVTHRIAKNHNVTVASSDGTEQVIILGAGAVRLSALGLLAEMERVNQEISQATDNMH